MGIAWRLSENRRRVQWQTVAVGFGLQVALGVMLILNPPAARFFLVLNRLVLVVSESVAAGGLVGIKTVANEMLSCLTLPAAGFTVRTNLIMTDAMCGFANFGSLGIMIGGIGAMVPERRAEIVGLGFKSIVAGSPATLMTGAVAGMLTRM